MAAPDELRGTTIPRVLAETVARCGDQVAIVDGETSLTYAELAGESRKFGAALVASGISPGDRVAIWAFNSAEWVVAALGSVAGRRGRSSRSTPGSRAPRRPTSWPAAAPGAGHRHRLPRHRLRRHARATPAPTCPTSTTVVVRGPAPEGATAWDDFLARATGEARGRGRPADRRAQRRRPVRHPLHLGHDRDAQGRRPDPRPDAAGGDRLGGDDRPQRRRPLPDGQPVLPHVRAQGRASSRRSPRGATMLPEPVFDVERRARPGSPRERVTVLPGAADALPVDPRPSRPRRATTCPACGWR